MNSLTLATNAELGGTHGRIVRLAASAANSLLGGLARILQWFLKKTVKLLLYIGILLSLGFLVGVTGVFIVSLQTDYEIVQEDGAYSHSDDPATTAFIEWLTNNGPVPQMLEPKLYRQYVRTIRENAGMEIPDNFLELSSAQLNGLAIEWYDQKYPDRTDTRDEKLAIINDLFQSAVRPPLEGFGPNVNERVWQVMGDAGAPRVRLVAEQDEYPSQMMAAYAPDGDRQAFYWPPDHTVYIRYNDSVKVLLNELPHAQQFTESPYTSTWQLFSSNVRAAFRGLVASSNGEYSTFYHDPDELEGEAHGERRAAMLQRRGLSNVFEEAPEMLSPQHLCVVPDPLNTQN